MNVRNPRSIIIISVYCLFNVFIVVSALRQKEQDNQTLATPGAIAPEFTLIEDLDYFHLKEGIPQMSVAAILMRSQGEEIAEFTQPKGVYNYQARNETIKYQAEEGTYRKAKDLLFLEGKVHIISDEAEYLASEVKYYFKKDLILGSGGVTFNGVDLKSQDRVQINAESMRAHPEAQLSDFSGNVNGSMQRKKQYEGKMTFSSRELQLNGIASLAHLEGDVNLKRGTYLITAGNGDIHLENYNKSLKYFVFNDDVKMTETLVTPEGTTYRKAFAERLEGFGKEQKTVLSGAPKVEYGKDVVKGYRITLRENMDLMEIEDNMADLQVKREEKKKKKN